MSEKPKVVIHTDGACSGNPGPGGWGVILTVGPAPQGAERRRRAHHQQSHGADGGDLGAGGAEVSLGRRPLHRLRTIYAAASPAGSRAGSATAGGPPTRSPCAISSCGSGSSRQPSGTTFAGTGSRAITAMTRMSVPTSSRARAWPRFSRTASARRRRTEHCTRGHRGAATTRRGRGATCPTLRLSQW